LRDPASFSAHDHPLFFRHILRAYQGKITYRMHVLKNTGSANGIRTRAAALRGLCPEPG
jgi:hypothetical protein